MFFCSKSIRIYLSQSVVNRSRSESIRVNSFWQQDLSWFESIRIDLNQNKTIWQDLTLSLRISLLSLSSSLLSSCLNLVKTICMVNNLLLTFHSYPIFVLLKIINIDISVVTGFIIRKNMHVTIWTNFRSSSSDQKCPKIQLSIAQNAQTFQTTSPTQVW